MSNLLNISLSTSSADELDYVLIEQEEWGKDVGRTSLPQGILAIGAMAFGGVLPLPNCGGFDGFDANVYAYPSRNDLAFKFAVSHGTCQSGIIQTLTRTEIINCSLQNSVDTKYPVQDMQSMVWIGPCYDKNGSIVPRPSVLQKGRFIYFSDKVLGSLRVTYGVYRIVYNVRIEKREYSIENNFESVAYTVWDGGINAKDIEVPSGYEYTDGKCDNGKDPDQDGSITTICPPPLHGTYPISVQADRNTKVGYCPQLILKDVITERAITSEDEDECE